MAVLGGDLNDSKKSWRSFLFRLHSSTACNQPLWSKNYYFNERNTVEVNNDLQRRQQRFVNTSIKELLWRRITITSSLNELPYITVGKLGGGGGRRRYSSRSNPLYSRLLDI
jgi:hypothetical protein